MASVLIKNHENQYCKWFRHLLKSQDYVINLFGYDNRLLFAKNFFFL